jgi:excisionase family DNA binding protein
MSDSNDLVLTAEAARLIGVSAETIRLWERLGRLPARRTPGGVRVFRRSDVENCARERQTHARQHAEAV